MYARYSWLRQLSTTAAACVADFEPTKNLLIFHLAKVLYTVWKKSFYLLFQKILWKFEYSKKPQTATHPTFLNFKPNEGLQSGCSQRSADFLSADWHQAVGFLSNQPAVNMPSEEKTGNIPQIEWEACDGVRPTRRRGSARKVGPKVRIHTSKQRESNRVNMFYVYFQQQQQQHSSVFFDSLSKIASRSFRKNEAFINKRTFVSSLWK